MLIRLTAAAMLTTFVATSVPTASFADNAKCQKLLRDLQKTLGDRRSSGGVAMLEDQCDVTTLLKSARMFFKMPDNLKF